MPAFNTTRTLGAVLLLSCLTTAAWGQDVRLLDCAQVQFFGPACVPLVPPALPDSPAPLPEPLFSPETMAPDTPPLLRRLLEEPSMENARAFLDWQHRRMARLMEVQQLLRVLAPPPGQR